MKPKRFSKIFIVLVLLFSPFGSSQHVSASPNSVDQLDAVVVNRDLTYWDATYFGFVDSAVYENWRLVFTAPHNFIVTAVPISGDLAPLLILLDANGNELARGTRSITSSKSAGNYSVQVQPESGSGHYMFTIRETLQTQASVTTVVNPTSVNVGETAAATVSLQSVPAEGFTSSEFTCTYSGSLVGVSNIVVGGLFGADPVVAINGPQNGSFIVAIAGSNGNKATTGGTIFTFSATGLQAGQSAIQCAARVSRGDGTLTVVPSSPANLTINGSVPTATFTPTAAGSPTPTFTPTATASPTPTFTSTPDGSPTPTGSPTATFTSTPAGSPTPTSTATSTSTPSPTNGTLTGQVSAIKPVTVGLYAVNTLVTSVTVNPDGTFSLSAPAGTYTVRATASGFLSAEGSITLTAGNTNAMPTISLLAGDIDSNNVIDQFDALTIGMNYNTTSPAAADLNNDGTINVLDLELLAQNYRETGPVAWE